MALLLTVKETQNDSGEECLLRDKRFR